ncbi:MAG TPA: helix-hairpin-helix domain-containing protein [Anaerolineae bacterium]|nr:helix-hairpin-helix domain-containing protein [Anaerolineae bacterium]
MPVQTTTNAAIADLLEQIADLLEQRDDNPYRVQAFRHGADSVRDHPTPLTEIVQAKGGEALTELEGIGQGLATIIFEFIETGRSSYREQLQRQPPEAIFKQVPGLGEELAHRIAFQLEINSLEELEQAAHDGRLERVHGFGPRRVAAIKHGLAGLLGRRRPPASERSEQSESRPSVALLLEVDADYRQRAAVGELPKLTPRRFNPRQEAWLPILRTEQQGWAMTVLFSNTARAPELGKTHDWVVIYYQKEGPEAQCTVVTETQGSLKGQRIIRGRERECVDFYRTQQAEKA